MSGNGGEESEGESIGGEREKGNDTEGGKRPKYTTYIC
jgi:hypothetical protein